MATWIVHLRIAEYFSERINMLDASEFAAGSVAPDCGYGKKDSFGEFTPPPCITHWTDTGFKTQCNYKDFYNKYLKNSNDNKAYSFYLGYYIHLLADMMWSATVYMPTRSRYAEQYAENPEFLKIIKLDWSDQDFKFLRDHPDLKSFRLLEAKQAVNDYLPYYEPSQLTTQIRYIVNYYTNNKNDRNLDRNYDYLTENDVTNFLDCAVWLIETKLKLLGIL